MACGLPDDRCIPIRSTCHFACFGSATVQPWNNLQQSQREGRAEEVQLMMKEMPRSLMKKDFKAKAKYVEYGSRYTNDEKW